jgi:cation:H+ antiporter
MDWLSIALFSAGLVILVAGAEALVRGAARLAAAFSVTPLVIGLTVVAFGTSSPELAVSLGGVLTGHEQVSLGTLVGSNIFNVLVILGLGALIAPLTVHAQLIRIEIPIMIGASVSVLAFGWNGSVNRWEGALLVLGIVGYTAFLVRQSRKASRFVKAEYAREIAPARGATPESVLVNLGLTLLGLGLLTWGAKWMVDGAVEIAAAIGLSQLAIGLTVVAIGTALPELATTVVAAYRGERDIAVGNVMGSNLFNILAILGLTALVSEGGIAVPDTARIYDIPVMIAVALACLPASFPGGSIGRGKGAIFLFCYGLYLSLLVLTAVESGTRDAFANAVAWIVLPLTALVLVALIGWEWSSRRQRGSLGAADSGPGPERGRKDS